MSAIPPCVLSAACSRWCPGRAHAEHWQPVFDEKKIASIGGVSRSRRLGVTNIILGHDRRAPPRGKITYGVTRIQSRSHAGGPWQLPWVCRHSATWAPCVVDPRKPDVASRRRASRPRRVRPPSYRTSADLFAHRRVGGKMLVVRGAVVPTYRCTGRRDRCLFIPQPETLLRFGCGRCAAKPWGFPAAGRDRGLAMTTGGFTWKLLDAPRPARGALGSHRGVRVRRDSEPVSLPPSAGGGRGVSVHEGGDSGMRAIRSRFRPACGTTRTSSRPWRTRYM